MSTSPTTVPPAQSKAAADATSSRAADLRARLSGLLQDQAYLTGLMTAAVANGADPAPARAAVDQTGVALAGVVGEAFGPAAGPGFLAVWRRLPDTVLAYARAKAAGDAAGATRARSGLETFKSDLAAFFGGLSPSLTTSTVTDLFSTPLAAMLTAADAQVSHGAQQYDSLRTAASATAPVAELLTRAFAAHAPDRYPGSPGSSASTLRTVTGDLLAEHVYLVAVATEAQLTGADVKAASNTLDANSQGLSNLLVSAYGSATGATFLGLWRGRVASFLDYARARQAGNQAGALQAAAGLGQDGQDLAGLLAGANPDLSRDALAGALARHATAVEAVIDAQAGHSPRWVALAQAGSGDMLATAATLASALAAQLPGRFTP